MQWPMWMTALFDRRAQSWKLSKIESWSEMGGTGPSVAGITVTPERAIGVPAVFACVQVLSQDVARTPIRLRRRVAADTFEDATEHDLYEILHALPNPETSAYTWKQQMMLDLLTHERAYAEIIRVDNRVSALWRLDPNLVHVDRDAQRRKRWRATLADGSTQTWTFDPSRPPIFELTHPSPIHQCRDLIGTALALQQYVGKFFANGAKPGGVLQTDSVLDPNVAKMMRDQFSSWHQGSANAHKVAMLQGGLKYSVISPPNDQAQLNETLHTIRTEIAGVFRVPTWKVGDLSKATYSNMAAGEEAYVNGTLDPLFTCWEHSIRRDLLTTRQFGQFDVSFDRSVLIRNDIKSLHEAVARGRDSGYYSANDCRRKLGENPIPADQGGDLYLCNGNMRPVTEAGNDGSE